VQHRQRKVLGSSDRACPECGNRGLTVTRSRRVRSGRQWLNPAWRAERRTYESCPACGARFALAAPSSPAVKTADTPKGRSPIGWFLLVLLVLVVLVETVVLAGMASFVSPWLSAGVVLGVMVAVMVIVWDARHRARR
jgi:hypothetical protein